MSLRLENISVSFGKHKILHEINLQVETGCFFSLLGPSGGGKSTLMKAIAGLLPLDQGNLVWQGRSIMSLPPEKREMTLVFQDLRLFPHLTVLDNVAFPLKMSGMKKEARREAAREILNQVELIDFAHRYPNQLSGGQQQRVALARAVAIKPRGLLLDEPFSSLDLPLRQSMRKLVRSLHDRLGLTTLLVTHDVGEAMLLSDCIGILDQGRLICCDSPAALLETDAATPYLLAWKREAAAQCRVLTE